MNEGFAGFAHPSVEKLRTFGCGRLDEAEPFAEPVPREATPLPPTVSKQRLPGIPVEVRPLRSRPRSSWPVVLGLLLFLGVLGAVPAVYRVKTDNGELVISTGDPDVEVVIKQNGKIVRIIDTKTGKEIKLHSGFYELELGDKEKGKGLKLSLDRVTIHRGDTVVATIARKKHRAVAAHHAPPLAKPALLHAIPWQDESQGFPAFIWQTGISSDGRLFFGAGDAGMTGSVRVFELATGKLVQELTIGEDTGGQIPYAFAQFVPGGKQIVVGYHIKKELYLWDLATGKLVRKFEGHTEPGAHFAVAGDGKRLLSWGDDKTVRLWDVESGKELRKLEGHTDKAAGVFSPDGKRVLTFSPDKTLRFWDVESGKELKKLEGHTDACTGCFAPDGKQVLSYSADGTLRLWDVATGKQIRQFEGSKAGVVRGGFVAGGRLVVASGDEHGTDRILRVWETASGKLVSEIDYDYDTYGTNGWTMTATPDGRRALVSVKDDSSIRVLDLTSGKEIHRFENCRGARSWSFSADGTKVVAGSFRSGMYVFRLPVPPKEK